MVLLGSHDSGACQSKNSCIGCCWMWAKTQTISLQEQFDHGIRLFDLRYKMEDGVFYISHTFSTSYSVQHALTELVQCALESNEYIFIRMKRDSSSEPLSAFGDFLQSIQINGYPLSSYVIEYDGSTLWYYLNKTPYMRARILFYSDDNTLHDDNVPRSWIFPQLFDTIETWGYKKVEEAVESIYEKKFKENGLPRAIFIDFSSCYPPGIAFEMVWERVQDKIIEYVTQGEIECIVLNCIRSDIVNYLHR